MGGMTYPPKEVVLPAMILPVARGVKPPLPTTRHPIGHSFRMFRVLSRGPCTISKRLASLTRAMRLLNFIWRDSPTMRQFISRPCCWDSPRLTEEVVLLHRLQTWDKGRMLTVTPSASIIVPMNSNRTPRTKTVARRLNGPCDARNSAVGRFKGTDWKGYRAETQSLWGGQEWLPGSEKTIGRLEQSEISATIMWLNSDMLQNPSSSFPRAKPSLR
jgi:hypothetical protein